MRSRLQLDVRNLSLWRRHLVNAYEVKVGIGLIAGNTVWSMPERLRGFTTRRYANPLYLYLYIIIDLGPKYHSRLTPIWRHKITRLRSDPRAITWCLRRCMCVIDLPALRTKRAVCTVKFVKSFPTWQHCSGLTSIRIFWRVLIPCPWYDFTQNLFVCWW